MGNDFSKGVDSAVAIVTGIITGDITGGLAGASAPWIAGEIKKQAGDNETARLVAHTILGAVVAELQGHSGVVGGASAVTGEIAAPIIQKALYGDRDVKDLTEEEKDNISALTQLAVGLTIASMGGDESDITTGVNSSKNAVENNLLSNKRGVEKLNEESRKLWEKIKDIVGYDEVDKLQEQYNDCKTDECRNNVYNEYMQKEQEAGQKLVELYRSGGLSEDEYFLLVSWYSDAMRDGIMEGQIDNRWNHSFGSWDIYDASGWDFTQTGLVNNPYLSEIRGLVLLNKWRSEGLSESEIQEKFIHDAILGSFASAPNVNQIIHKIRNEGLSYEDALMLASNALYGKIISEAMNGKVLPPKGNKNSENHNIKEVNVEEGRTTKESIIDGASDAGSTAGKGTNANKPLNKTDLEHQYGKGNVEQGGGNYKETKDNIYDNQVTNQKANESSNFGEHVKNEKDLNNKPLDKDYFESEYGKGNVQQGGGNYKETKDKIHDNQITNQKGNQSSNFEQHTNNESKLAENWNNTNQAHNASNKQKLKEDLSNENLQNIAKKDPRLNNVVNGHNGKLNYGVGSGTTAEANKLGMQWVGEGAKKTSDGGWISADGTRGYRPPSNKPNSSYAETGVQANFETYKFDDKGKRIKVGNGHLNIKD
ncbi:VENN motif pre-toxin domain-containing protein [Gilliamella sp. wkB108]|uniref:VENN motif pre-toxin domain-containing protein n=1 Tax=Gilliamella sp. wkB108 TaxID=3120256 RepID=UPI0009BDDB54|nr:VENN motif pre-toxin domain-containing protein [Gilliamella apicola]